MPSFRACFWLWTTAVVLVTSPAEARPWKTRTEFARRMNQVRESMTREASPDELPDYEGMTDTEVRRLLGRPDAVFERRSDRDYPITVSVSWRYGCMRGCPHFTLGQVDFNSRRRVISVFGGAGDPPPEGTVPEHDLREAIRRISAIPDLFRASPGDPLPLIRATNFLQRMGEDRALASAREYERVHYWATNRREISVTASEALHPLMNTLFRSAAPAEAPDPFSLEPYWLRGVPLWQPFRGGLGGSLAFSPELFQEYAEGGPFLANPIRPPDNPLRLLPGEAPSNEVTSRLGAQLLLLVRSVYRPVVARDYLGSLALPAGVAGAQWRRMITDVDQLGIRWDPRRDDYVFPDDSQLPPERPWSNRPLSWHATADDLAAYVTLVRVDPRRVEVTVQLRLPTTKQLATLRLVQEPSEFLDRRELATYSYPPVGRQLRYIELPQGAEVRLELTSGDHRKTSARLQP